MKLYLRYFFVLLLLCVTTANAQSDSLSIKNPLVFPADLSLISVTDGYIPSTQFNGYLNPNNGTSIVMTMIKNVSAPLLDQAKEEDSLFTLLSRTSYTSSLGYQTFVYKEKTTVGETDIIHYSAFIGHLNTVLWLSISHPAQLDMMLEKELLQIIENTNLNSIK